jgi:hypothetical protein
MLKTKTKLDDLLEKYKDLNLVYVSNKLEEYGNLVHYYFILHTKQQMEYSNAKLDEWWLVEVQFKEEMYKNLVAHKKDEFKYKRHLFAFKKAFPNFMYKNSNNLELSNPVHEAKEAKCSGAAHEQQEEEPMILEEENMILKMRRLRKMYKKFLYKEQS